MTKKLLMLCLAIPLTLTWLSCGVLPQQEKATKGPEPKVQESKSNAQHKVKVLMPDEVLSWRSRYGDLLGKPLEAAIERFGQPDPSEAHPVVKTWKPTAKTGDRTIGIGISGSEEKISTVKVFSKEGETLDAIEILKKAPAFTFETGTFEDSTSNYFIALSKDGRNAFQFAISDSAVSFEAISFSENKKP